MAWPQSSQAIARPTLNETFVNKTPRQLRPFRNKALAFWPDISIGTIFTTLTCVIIVRSVLEAVLEDHALSPKNTEFYAVIIGYIHIYLAWVCLFVAFALLVRFFLRLPLIQSFKLVLLCSPLIVIVPLLDYYFTGGSDISYAGNFSDFTYNFINLYNPAAHITMVSLGVRIEVFLATSGSFFASWLYFRNTLLRSALFAVSMYATIFFFGYLPAIMPSLVRHSYLDYLPMYLPVFIALTILVLTALYFESPSCISVVRELIFPSRLLFYILLLSFGMIFTAKQIGEYPALFRGDGFINLSLATLSITLLFAYAKLQNDFYDKNIDVVSNPGRSIIFAAMRPADIASLKILFVLLSAVFGLASNRYFLPLWLLIFALSSLYSEPPMRLRRFYPLGHITLAMIGVSVFMAGCVLAGAERFFNVPRVPGMSICVFFTFFFLSHIKDLKDIDGDRHARVMNVYNMTKSPRAVAIAVLCSFTAMLILDLSSLSIYGFASLLPIAVFLALVLTILLRSRDLRCLDWILCAALVLLLVVSLEWLLAGTS